MGEQALTIVRTDPLPPLTIVSSEPEPSFGKRMADAAIDMPAGMVKQAGRYAQMIPGVAAATDKVYGLPPGASRQAMEPSNLNQQVGGYLGDLAAVVATGGAEAGGPILSRTAGYVSNPTVAARGVATLGDAAKFTGDVAGLVRSQLAVGPLTPVKVASLITKYGKDTVALALKASLGYGAYQAFKHLF